MVAKNARDSANSIQTVLETLCAFRGVVSSTSVDAEAVARKVRTLQGAADCRYGLVH
jgi:hypothetical protein